MIQSFLGSLSSEYARLLATFPFSFYKLRLLSSLFPALGGMCDTGRALLRTVVAGVQGAMPPAPLGGRGPGGSWWQPQSLAEPSAFRCGLALGLKV